MAEGPARLDLAALGARYTTEADPFDDSTMVIRIPRVPMVVTDVRDLLSALRAHRAALQRVVDDTDPPWQYDELRAVLVSVEDGEAAP